MPYYAEHRDRTDLPGCRLRLYPDWDAARPDALRAVVEADVVIVTSYCPDGIAATGLALDHASGLTVFYDLDTPVTLSELRRGAATSYIGPHGLAGFDLVLSYTGGAALSELRSVLGARRAAPLYGHVDPEQYRPGAPRGEFGGDLSYLGTYAADRQAAVERFLVEPARLRPERRFTIGGAQYPADFPWTGNIFFLRHLPPGDHADFYASSRTTLNVTRRAMAEMGWCPSGRLFEAAACGAAILTDTWAGLGDFFEPGSEILALSDTEDVLAALDLPDAELRRIGRAARARVLAAHPSARRAAAREDLLAPARSREPAAAPQPEEA